MCPERLDWPSGTHWGTAMCRKPGEMQALCHVRGTPQTHSLARGGSGLSGLPGLAVELGANRKATYDTGPACRALYPRPLESQAVPESPSSAHPDSRETLVPSMAPG